MRWLEARSSASNHIADGSTDSPRVPAFSRVNSHRSCLSVAAHGHTVVRTSPKYHALNQSIAADPERRLGFCALPNWFQFGRSVGGSWPRPPLTDRKWSRSLHDATRVSRQLNDFSTSASWLLRGCSPTLDSWLAERNLLASQLHRQGHKVLTVIRQADAAIRPTSERKFADHAIARQWKAHPELRRKVHCM